MKKPDAKQEDTEDDVPSVKDEEGAGTEGITVPEEFQSSIHSLLCDATKEQCAHVRDKVYSREDELRKANESGDKTMSVDTAVEE